MGDWLALSWKVLILRGVLGLAFGLMAMVWPDVTVVVLVVLFGIWALADGFTEALAAFSSGIPGTSRLLHGLMAVAGIVAGLFALLRPGMAATTLTWVLGFWLIVRAIAGVVEALSGSARGSRGMLFLGAGLDLVLGILFVANPGRSALGIAWVLGLVALIWGVVFIVTGLMVRNVAKHQTPPAVPA
jgi:uncharacterized membrane protein HdeD (DUF308 family)